MILGSFHADIQGRSVAVKRLLRIQVIHVVALESKEQQQRHTLQSLNTEKDPRVKGAEKQNRADPSSPPSYIYCKSLAKKSKQVEEEVARLGGSFTEISASLQKMQLFPIVDSFTSYQQHWCGFVHLSYFITMNMKLSECFL